MRRDALFNLPELPEADLEWMLQSSEISDAALIGVLVEEFAGDLLRLASAISAREGNSRNLVQHTIAQAVLKRHQYWSNSSARVWLFYLLLQNAAGESRWWRRLPWQNRQQPMAKELQLEHFHNIPHTLTRQYSLLLLLHYLFELSLDEIQRITQQPAALLQFELGRLHNALKIHQQNCPQCSAHADDLTFMESAFRQDIRSAAPASPFTVDAIQEWTASIRRQVEQSYKTGHIQLQAKEKLLAVALLLFAFAALFALTRQQADEQNQQNTPGTPVQPETHVPPFYYSVKSQDTLESIALNAGVPPAVIMEMNALVNPNQIAPGLLIKIPGREAQAWQITPRPRIPLPLPTSLPANPGLEEIRQRAVDSPDLWQMLWVDLLVVQHGLPGYIGPPQTVTRKQAWIAQPDHLRLVYGPAEAGPSDSYAITAGREYAQNFLSGIVYESLASEMVLSDLAIDYDLQRLLTPERIFLTSGSLVLAGSEPVAGRPAWVIDGFSSSGIRVYRYWLDQEYGILLRVREFSSGGGQAALSDTIITAIQIDSDRLPASVFDPLRYPGRLFARDITGAPDMEPRANDLTSLVGLTGHEPRLSRPAPTDFDPAHSRLTWQRIAYNTSQAGQAIELFADDYSLGKMEVGSGSLLTCRRSPDGKRIAFNLARSGQDTAGETILYFANLKPGIKLQRVLPEGTVRGDFQFSPDSLRLAFFGCRTQDGCGVYLLDLIRQDYHQLHSMTFADYLLWKPDGESLGLVADRRGDHEWEYLVLRTSDGEVEYRGKFDWGRLSPQPDAPPHSWGVYYRSLPGGLEACALPPEP